MGRSAALSGLADVVTALSLHADHPRTFGSRDSSGLQSGWDSHRILQLRWPLPAVEHGGWGLPGDHDGQGQPPRLLCQVLPQRAVPAHRHPRQPARPLEHQETAAQQAVQG